MKKIIFCCLAILGVGMINAQGVYIGTGSVSQGIAATIDTNIFVGCTGARTSGTGTISSTDGKSWVVPAEVTYKTAPKLPDLYNECNGMKPSSLTALNANSLPVTVIDNGGDTITGFIFSDNYCELYINGILIGVDPVPYTPFNSCVVRFKVSRPYTVAVKLVDWEEHLGVGTENNNGNLYHAGDGGFIAEFSDGTVTDTSWKAQTFYISPIENLSTVVEFSDSTRSSSAANTAPACNGNCYGIHYVVPSDWNTVGFNEGYWPNAHRYSAAQVTNSVSYTNFANTAWSKAQFIWSSNLILDNLVLVRKTVGVTSSLIDMDTFDKMQLVNPFEDKLTLSSLVNLKDIDVSLFDITGRELQQWKSLQFQSGVPVTLDVSSLDLTACLYVLKMNNKGKTYTFKLIHNANQ